MEILFGILAILLVPTGWVLGVVGFFHARRALRELASLRQELASGRELARMPEPPTPPPFGTPWPGPEEDQPAPAPQKPSMPQSLPEPAIAAAEILEPAMAMPMPPAPPKRRMDVEELLTLRWGVWLGGAALLFAGVFLVRYAVEEGFLGPTARCFAAALLGMGLIGAAEWLRGRSVPVANLPWPDQAPPALAAGGVAVLFGAAFGFGIYYALVPPLIAFILMAGAGFIGLGLSLRHGQLVAAIGIVGAFATPVLVQTENPSIPGLYAYLFVVTAAALAVVRYAAWVWLGWSTTIACAFWVLLGAAEAGQGDAWAPGLFVPAVTLLYLALLPRAAMEFWIGRALVWVPYAALGLSGMVVYLALPGWAPRIGILLLAPLAIWKGAAEPRLDRLPWLSVLFFLLTLLGWALPLWHPTGEIVGTQEYIQAVLPGGWAPDVIRPLLFTAAIMAAMYVAAGLWLERLAPRPLVWSALVAAVPTLTLGITYTMVERFQARPLWALAAALLAAGQTMAAEAARREGEKPFALQRAGVHAAGAVASLALGLAMILADQWLTMAVALLLPPLAIIEARAELPALRKVALAVAGLVLTRLLLNWYVFDYALGGWPVVNTLLLTYGLPAACFALASRMFRQRADDLLVAVLESGAVAFATVLVSLEIRHWAGGGTFDGNRASGFLEAGLHVCSLAILALMTMRGAVRLGRRVLDVAWRIQGGLALFGGFLLLLANPGLTGTRVDGPAIFNALLAAYLVPAMLAALALRQAPVQATRAVPKLLSLYALVAVFAWITLEIRHAFHPGRMDLVSIFNAVPVTDAELWCWSAAWLAYGIALMVGGIRMRLRAVRLSALAVVGLTAAKVFLIDMSGLTGLWRALSFLGLGLTLIGLGAVFRRFVSAHAAQQEEPPPPA